MEKKSNFANSCVFFVLLPGSLPFSLFNIERKTKLYLEARGALLGLCSAVRLKNRYPETLCLSSTEQNKEISISTNHEEEENSKNSGYKY